MKHTSAPWHIVNNEYSWPVIADANGINVAKTDCSLSSGEWHDSIERAKENANLIAAAPDLLEACEAFVGACDTAPPIELITCISNACNKARMAIAKAKQITN